MSLLIASTVIGIIYNQLIYFNGLNPSFNDITTFTPSDYGKYKYLDYILVGGGGGGGGSFTAYITAYGGGGGGSGDINASFPFTDTNGTFTYNVTATPGSSTIQLAGTTSVTLQIGAGGNGGTFAEDYPVSGSIGSSTTLTITGNMPQTIVAFGGSGGGGGFPNPVPYNIGSGGGTGFNGGGGGGTAEASTGKIIVQGIAGNSTGNGSAGTTSQLNSSKFTSGAGGGNNIAGGANNQVNITFNTDVYGEYQELNVGGGGGDGTQVILNIGSPITGGRGSYGSLSNTAIPPAAPAAVAGIDYTGAGGGGGALSAFIQSGGGFSGQSLQNGSNGGKGYAILWFHN
jgi:hypothetical protein